MKPILFFLSFFLLVQPGFAQTLRLAVYRYADNPRTQNLEPLAAHLQTKLGVPVTVESKASVHDLIGAMQAGEVDIAFISTFGYLLLQAGKTPHPMQPVAALVAPHAINNYKTAIVSRKGSGITHLTDLFTLGAGKRMAFVATGSTSGNLVPRLLLNGIGIGDADTHFSSIHYAGTHAKAISALLSGSADVAAMGSAEWESLDTVQKNSLQLLSLSPEIPLGPVLLKTELEERLQQKIRAELLDLHQSNAAALQAIKDAWTEAKQATHFVPVGEAYYTPFLQQLGTETQVATILIKFIR
ncbi:MAG: phosphate/phosphite/phosphonate ABC transporter substrate-binding protein [Chitinophagaceae bacterium]|nr:MAG: phosphate/phosphite/phosphonate ABC transporter substrate-binding protein [Chitinophagaceae bacterium]